MEIVSDPKTATLSLPLHMALTDKTSKYQSRSTILYIMSLSDSVYMHTRIMNYRIFPNFRLGLIMHCVINQMVVHPHKSALATMTRM